VTKSEDTPEGEMFDGIEDQFNRYWLRKLVGNMADGRRDYVEAGIYSSGGKAPYGYILQGKKRDARLIIVPEQAEVIRLIFSHYASGMGAGELARLLMERHILTPGDVMGRPKKRARGVWTADHLYPLLRETAYIGTAYLYKTKREDGKLRKAPQAERLPVAVPAIVDQATRDRVQRRLDEGKVMALRNTKYDYLMARRLKCGCGYSVRAKPTYNRNGTLFTHYYVCLSNSGKKTARAEVCGLPHFRTDVVDAAVWDWVVQLVKNPRALLEG